MAHWRRILVGALGAVILVSGATVTAAADEGGTLIRFDSMTPVPAGHPTVRLIPGGGLPWAIESGRGRVTADGDVNVRVRGLVLAAGTSAGTNPISKFNAVVSCVTSTGISNVKTPAFPADMQGDSRIKASVALPAHCADPIVFVGFSPTPSTFRWFARSNAEADD